MLTVPGCSPALLHRVNPQLNQNQAVVDLILHFKKVGSRAILVSGCVSSSVLVFPQGFIAHKRLQVFGLLA